MRYSGKPLAMLIYSITIARWIGDSLDDTAIHPVWFK